jgi:hypothetical protein
MQRRTYNMYQTKQQQACMHETGASESQSFESGAYPILLVVTLYEENDRGCWATTSRLEAAIEPSNWHLDCDNGLYTYQSNHNRSLSFSLVCSNLQHTCLCTCRAKSLSAIAALLNLARSQLRKQGLDPWRQAQPVFPLSCGN